MNTNLLQVLAYFQENQSDDLLQHLQTLPADQLATIKMGLADHASASVRRRAEQLLASAILDFPGDTGQYWGS